MPHLPRRYFLIALIVLFLTAVWLINGIQYTYMHPDEYLVYEFTSSDLGYTVWYQTHQDVHPPTWFAFFWFWRRLVGDSEFMGRIQAAFFSLITLALVYQIGRRWFGAARYGIFAMVALATGVLFFQYGLEIRPYALAMLLASWSMFAFQQWLKRQDRTSIVVYAVTLAAMLYVHYFLALVILTQMAYFLLFGQAKRRLSRQGLSVAALAFILWLPLLPTFLGQVALVRSVEVSGGNARGLAGTGATTQPTSVGSVVKLAQLATNGEIILFVLILGIGIRYGWRKRNIQLALVWGIGLPALTFLLNLFLAVYTPRYIVNFIVGLSVATGTALASFPLRWRWPMLAGFAIICFWSLPSQLPSDRIPYRDLVGEMVAVARPDDVILFDQGNDRDDVLGLELRRQLPSALLNNRIYDPDQVIWARRIWYVTANWFNDDVRTHFARLEATHPVQQVIGKCDRGWCFLMQLLEGPPQLESDWFGGEIAFWGADLDQVGDSSIKTRLWWTVEQLPTMDYSISLQLLDEHKVLIAQADGSIRDQYSGSVVTSQLQPGRFYIDHREILLPSPLSPGEYKLALVVYNWQTGKRLLLTNGADHVTLQTIQIGSE